MEPVLVLCTPSINLNLILAMDVPILVVPAMHPQMWSNSATLANVQTLRQRGIHIMEPAVGALTSGDIGKGRLPETQEIIAEIESLLSSANDFAGRKILITAGGTREPIDPVRFIGNRSSGKQGYAIAREAARRGAKVSLIAANSQLADIDGVVIIPQNIIEDTIIRSEKLINTENLVRKAIKDGMDPQEAYLKFGAF